MAHSDLNKLISQIKLPNGEVYEIHDEQAIHSIEELGLSAALVFKGTKATDAEIKAITGAKEGDVYLSTETNTEFVWTGAAWEALGNVHDAAASDHIHDVTVTGTNAASTVTGTVNVPTVSKTQKYMSVAASAAAPAVEKTTDAALGAGATFKVTGGEAATTKIKATAAGVAVAGDGTANAITGFGAHTTDAALGAGATFKVTGGAATTSKMVTSTASKVTVTEQAIPNVTANTEVKASKLASSGSVNNGTAAAWSASVTNGVLSFDWTANTPTTATLPTFSEVTATNTTLGTAINASVVSAEDVTVATGALSTSGTGSAVATGVGAISVAVDDADEVAAITALGEATTAAALTGVKVTAQPTVTLAAGTTGDVAVATGVSAISVAVDDADAVTALTGVTVAAPAITASLTNNDTNVTGAVPVVSAVEVGSASVNLQNGTAAAQAWTMSTGVTGEPQ